MISRIYYNQFWTWCNSSDVCIYIYIFELGKHCKTTHRVLHIVQEIAPWLYIHQTLHMSARWNSTGKGPNTAFAGVEWWLPSPSPASLGRKRRRTSTKRYHKTMSCQSYPLQNHPPQPPPSSPTSWKTPLPPYPGSRLAVFPWASLHSPSLPSSLPLGCPQPAPQKSTTGRQDRCVCGIEMPSCSTTPSCQTWHFVWAQEATWRSFQPTSMFWPQAAQCSLPCSTEGWLMTWRRWRFQTWNLWLSRISSGENTSPTATPWSTTQLEAFTDAVIAYSITSERTTERCHVKWIMVLRPFMINATDFNTVSHRIIAHVDTQFANCSAHWQLTLKTIRNVTVSTQRWRNFLQLFQHVMFRQSRFCGISLYCANFFDTMSKHWCCSQGGSRWGVCWWR